MLLLTKTVIALMAGFLVSTFLGFLIVPLLKELRLGQKISSYVGTTHKKKEGTPTMGGLIFILGSLLTIAYLIFAKKIDYTANLGIVLLVFIGYAIIGFIDDILSVKKGNNEGLTIYQKLFMQVIIAIGFFFIYMRSGGQTSLAVATLGIDIEMKWLYGIFILFVLVGSSNSVNLTDGLDGLAGGLSAIAFVAFSLISLTVGFEEIGIFLMVLAGSLLGFLIFNHNPAKVFMGDTGSLALGGVMGTVAILTHREITLLVVASLFVIETLSVILQNLWVIIFRRKLFLMTPIHHHFEKIGWEERDIVNMFWIAGVIVAMAGIAFAVWL